MKVKDWVIWNKETKSILAIGTQSEMTERSEALNEIYQTDAYIPQEFVPEKAFS